jgi:hypothetical protein
VALFIEKSSNSKIVGKKGKVSATYGSIANTCPKSCPLQDSGCYAQFGHTNIHVKRADKVTAGMTPLQAAKLEANAINASFKGGDIPQDGTKGGRDLRLHVSGDCKTKGAAKALAKAGDKWYERGGGAIWCYTHAWEKVERDNWGEVSILASVEDPTQTKLAKAQGYASAIVVQTFPSEKAFKVEESDVSWIPCPQQTKGVSCSDCRLCFNADRLRDNDMGIAFAVHGSGSKKAVRKLKVL